NSSASEYSAKAVIVRQSGGKRLHARFDTPEITVPGAPQVTALRDSAGVRLSWPAPDDGGSPITGYRVYRRTANGSRSFLADAGTSLSYRDATADPSGTYFYSVGAVNAAGESVFCAASEATPTPAPDPCHLPGISLATDA